MTRFRYQGDRLFQACCLLYALNRWVFKPLISPGFFHSYFNDLLLIPCALPLMLLVHRKLGLRAHDRPPTVGEILLHLGIWSILFELTGPLWMTHTTADPRDLVAYATGAILAGLWWNRNRFPSIRVA